tara:strand:- start:226 stop:1611 length:1386 start_codon:yes stop_codon:yes gene_type:complete
MTFPKYPEYKDSGVEWLGEVPAHWELRKISHGFNRIGSGTTPPSNEQKWYEGGSIPWVTTSELRENLILETKKSITDEALSEFTSLQVHPPGSLAIAMYGATIGRLGIFGVSATTNQACCVLSGSKSIGSRFVFYWLLAFKNEIVSFYATGGGQPNINQETIASLRLPAPSLEDQTKIAAFLDHETTRIDALVEEQQRLIELLKEKRQAVISHAVTKGLDPDVPMKDSGVEWLGGVPEHWEVKPLRHLGECQNGINIGADAFGSGFPFVSYGDVYKNEVLPTKPKGLVQSSGEDRERYSMKKGDVLFTRTSETVEEIGFSSTCLQDIPSATFAGFLIRFRPDEGVLSPSFSRYFFGSRRLREFFVKEMEIVTRASLGQDLLKRMSVPIAPIEEQVRTAQHLDAITQKIDSLLNQARAAVKLLAERRSALISAAVTGKIDVRGWEPPASSATSSEATQTEMV